MATFTKTIQTALASLQNIAASTVVVGSAFDFGTKLGGIIGVRFGRRSATASSAGCNIRLECSFHASLDNSWYPFAVLTTSFALVESEAVTGTVASGQKVITVASTTNLIAGGIIFISNGTAGNSEWARIVSVVTNTSVTIEDNLVNAQTSSTIYAGAEIFNGINVPDGCKRIRAVIDGSLFTQAYSIEVDLITIDSIA
ncbi:MAG: hypothetical protein ABI851_12055 [Saprospiraceae bacterium]